MDQDPGGAWVGVDGALGHTENRKVDKSSTGLGLDLEWTQVQLKCGPGRPRRCRKEAH